MSSLQEQYDTAFLGILQNEGTIVKFLDVCFSFLFRRTDFYRRMRSPNENMGFPEGVAEKLVMQAFKRYDKLMKEMMDSSETKLSNTVKGHTKERPPVAACAADQDTDKTNLPESETESEGALPTGRKQPKVPVTAVNTEPTTSSAAGLKPTNTKEGNSDSLSMEEERQTLYQANPDSYNGAIRDAYSWSQSITDVDLKVQVPGSVQKGKEVQVIIKRKHICVGYKEASGELCTVVNSDLMWEVHKDECLWSLEPGKCVTINLEKVQERWWEAVFTDEPKINVQKIDPSRPITDLDDEAQSKIEEMMYNERQKKLGLPLSHEQKVHDMLRQGWDAEGSPFKGQPFDPSKLNIASDTSKFTKQ